MPQPYHSSYGTNQNFGSGSRLNHGAAGSYGNHNQMPQPGFGVAPPNINGAAVSPAPGFQGVPSGPRLSQTFPSSNYQNGPPRHYQTFQQRNNHSYQPQQHQSQQSQQLRPNSLQSNAISQETQQSSSLPHDKGWTSNSDPYFSAMFDTDGSSSIRKTRAPRGTNRQGGQSEASKGIRGRKFGYALIGKEAEQYITEDLREQLASAILPIAGDPTVPSPMTSTKLAPQTIVDEFKRAGHLDATRTHLNSLFQSSGHKDQLLQSLQTYLLQRIKDMTPEARQKMASQTERSQQTELNRWFEESTEAADMIDDVLDRLRGEAGDEGSLFATHGVIGSKLENCLGAVIQAEKRRAEHRKAESSDEEGNSTPLNKGSVASGGSRTPIMIASETK